MTRVAILLRGQPRFSTEGGLLFEKFVKQHHPGVEFKVFAHSWNTLSKRMVHTDSENTSQERAIFETLSDTELTDAVSTWNPVATRFDTESDNIRLAGEILKYNVNQHSGTFEWFEQYLKQNDWEFTDGRFGNRNLLLPEGLKMNSTFKVTDTIYNTHLQNQLTAEVYDEQIRFSYLLGQMHSAGLSFNLLQDYMAKTGYSPDLVISTRYDVCLWIHSFPKLLFEIQNSQKSGHPFIMSRLVSCINGRPMLDDYAFFGNMLGYIAFLSDIRHRLFNTFTGDIMQRFNIIGSGSHLQHLLWTKLADPQLAFIQPSINHWRAFILRPGHFDISSVKRGSDSEYTTLLKQSLEYEYPDNPKGLTNEEIIELWKKYNG